MDLIFQGILLGLMLSVLLGPIFFIITQASIKYGKKAGIYACLGVWVSDLLYIGVTYFFVKELQAILQSDSFNLFASIIGGGVIFLFGVVLLFAKPKPIEIEFKEKSNFNYWLRGFAINTFNPFTLVFWLSVITSKILGGQLDHLKSTVFLTSIMVTIVLTDYFKVALASKIQPYVTEKFLTRFSKIVGIGLMLFSAFIVYKIYTEGLQLNITE